MTNDKALFLFMDELSFPHDHIIIHTTFSDTQADFETEVSMICTTQPHFCNTHVLFDLGYTIFILSHNGEVVTKITPDGKAVTNRFGKTIVCGRRIHPALNLEKLLLANDFETF